MRLLIQAPSQLRQLIAARSTITPRLARTRETTRREAVLEVLAVKAAMLRLMVTTTMAAQRPETAETAAKAAKEASSTRATRQLQLGRKTVSTSRKSKLT